ncbi:hypothetical protein NEUTE1DRAFT_117165 [Neurospora tetrasperma FGSC 2508]|uniref:Uncharacterized protein n=1 Tax=Neurospora tetrasperma (strain FGSC 2508 / ATCC MYA-4615 / P0657) TaxID=510951 RepID=F8MLM8_NEUT8|nr:uncharacterized protein NEUTE1DRAFT_117165 [Neurospora tetrasperma FGSC 2508]EGO58447.1 hypothetical protein NEUTE1DRAFT_117165 [Neurospora tetrasperma FGSC 2508]EGZ71218.1 hypothetical protein NEUTE2DRAFT_144444 [Neurospora tetrasperma FGSC 2509]
MQDAGERIWRFAMRCDDATRNRTQTVTRAQSCPSVTAQTGDTNTLQSIFMTFSV